jgi:hypothetical protein
MKAARRAVLAAGLACAALVTGAPGGRAAAVTPNGHIALAAQTTWVTAGGEFDLVMRVSSVDDPADLEVALIIHPALTSRSDFDRSVAGHVTGSALKVVPMALGDLDANHAGTVRAQLFVQDRTLARDDTRLQLRSPGVYPVEVELRESGGGRVADRFVTHLVYVPAAPQGPRLGVAWVVPVHAPPAHQADGTARLSDASSSALATLAEALDHYPTLALTLHPTPETLEALATSPRASDGDTLRTLARAAQAHTVLAGTYVPVSPPAYGTDQESELAAQLEHGTDVLDATVHVRPDPRVQVADDGLDDASVTRLQDQQVDRLVVREATLAAIPMRLTLGQPFQLAGRPGRRPLALAADNGLTSRFAESDPVLGAHHLLADLAVAYFESPALTRGVVAFPTLTWRPSAAFLDAFLSGLSNSPVLQPMTVNELFDGVPVATAARRVPLVRKLNADATHPAALPTALRTVRSRLDEFGSLVDPDTPAFVSLDETLLVAQSTDLRAAQRRDYVNAVNTRIDHQLAQIRVPASRSITLTARQGEIPVTILNSAGYPLHVQIHVSSDQLRFPGGARAVSESVELTHRNTTVRFRVQARASGSFPMRIEIVSPDGRLTVGSTRFVVRSTSASGVGILLSAGAALFLLVWWARHALLNRRRPRHAVGVGAT